MPFVRSQATAVADIIQRIITLDKKIEVVAAASKLDVDGSDDLSLTGPATVTAYVAALTARRDALIAGIKPTVAGW